MPYANPAVLPDRLDRATPQLELAMTTGDTTTHGLIAIPRVGDAQAAAETGVWWRVSAPEVHAIADLLRRPPAQQRSVARVATILDLAAQATHDPELTTTTLAERCGMSVGSIYQFFGDLDRVLVCVAAVWMHRTINATVHALVTGRARTPDELAGLLTGLLAAYRSHYRPSAPSKVAIRARADRERAWHHQLAAALCSLLAGHASEDGRGEQSPNMPPEDRQPTHERPREPGTLETQCLTAVALADQAARAAAAGTGPRASLADEMARATALYIADADLATPPRLGQHGLRNLEGVPK